MAHFDELAALITREHGKCSRTPRAELTRGTEIVEFACGIPQLLKGQFSDNIGGDIDNWSLRQPVGVCVGITPFNFPAMVPMWMFPVAIACGNTFVLKPSERDSSALRSGWPTLLEEAGLPQRCAQRRAGRQGSRRRAAAAPGRRGAVSFVGSTPVAEHIYTEGTRHGKRVQALGGAKNHLIGDARRRSRSGRGCAHRRRLRLRRRAVHGDLGCSRRRSTSPTSSSPSSAARIRDLKIGGGSVARGRHGPADHGRASATRSTGYIEGGVRGGAKLVVDGRGLSVVGHENGFFLGGVVVRRRASRRCASIREEIFGPVLSVVRVPDFAAARASSSTRTSTATAWRVLHQRRRRRARSSRAPSKRAWWASTCRSRCRSRSTRSAAGSASLFGDHHIYGEEGVRFYTRYKSVMQRWPGSGRERARVHDADARVSCSSRRPTLAGTVSTT